MGVIMAAMVLLLQNVWGCAFSQEQEVLVQVSRTTPYLAVLVVLNCCQTVLAGLLRGVGWQKWGVYAKLGAHYGVGLPTAFILVLVFHFNGRGLWIGMLSGVAVQTVALTIISLSANWENLSGEALDRIFSSESSLPCTIVPLLDDKDAIGVNWNKTGNASMV
ncbi:unnamed protein product [Sphagnum jensenii]|uniref:MATE transporter n=1 Tax=Sphagnum jensenii TaxID=128206 RepID=A0ABP1ACV7_9BRYO